MILNCFICQSKINQELCNNMSLKRVNECINISSDRNTISKQEIGFCITVQWYASFISTSSAILYPSLKFVIIRFEVGFPGRCSTAIELSR